MKIPPVGRNLPSYPRREKWAKLDKFLLNRDWADSGLDCRADLMDLTIESDHCPMVLSLFGTSPSGSKPFKFFNMWTHRDDFGEIVRRVWEGPLKALNSKVFGHISIKATKAKDEYKSLMKLLVDDPSNPSLIDMNSKKTEATFLIDAKRSFLQKKAMCDFLVDSDKGTLYFHTHVKYKTSKAIPFWSEVMDYLQ
ncbi:unnamed protein product [Cuscuta campestris]|uniref:Endonuclease/exonuclease/phosphatase domain-containing protein n=1 Tax=Cuscuta campestris TaxID=132261 RepID=A0A484KRY1_9ASTE|nr:unnamed protein product [Cuscuta campestris]